MSRKLSKIPDSDVTPRDTAKDQEPDLFTDPAHDPPQTSTKSGKHSSVMKKAASRPERATGNAAKPVPGAFGKDEDLPTRQETPHSEEGGRD